MQAQYATLHGPIHSPLDAVESCTLGRETAPKHNVSTSMLDGGDGVIFSILPPPNTASRVDAKELDFGLTTSCLPILLRIIQVFIGKLQTALYMCFLEQGTLRVLQYFKPLRRSVLPMVFLVTVVPAALRSFTSSPCVVLGLFYFSLLKYTYHYN